MNDSYNGKGEHGYAGVWGGQFASYHHNLLAHHHSRAIRFNGSRTHDTLAYVDYRNNVIYNWGVADGCYGNEIEIADTSNPIFPLRKAEVNIMNNYYKPGPATSSSKAKVILLDYDVYATNWASRLVGKAYIDGNYVNGQTAITSNNWTGLKLKYYPTGLIDSFKLPAPTQSEPIVMQSAQDAYTSVLAYAGDIYPKRDTLDRRIVNETLTGTASQHSTVPGSSYYGKGNLGIIDTQDSVGGWPNYDTTALAPVDSDHDGMPDDWEISMHLNPNDSTDGNTINTLDGYTMLEEYLNGLVLNPLPLNLTFFNAVKKDENNADLMWGSANEVNTKEFKVERSVDGKTFVDIGVVPTTNNFNGSIYSFTDNNLMFVDNRQVYYRLKIVDVDGSFNYSNVVVLKKKIEGITVSPNPANSFVNITHELLPSDAVINMYAIDGKKVLTVRPVINSTNTQLDISSLLQGSYILTVSSSSLKALSKVIKW